MVGWYSETSAQTLETDLLTREILEGSPPSSSKSTKRFCVGFNQDRGTWYLTGEILLELMKKLFASVNHSMLYITLQFYKINHKFLKKLLPLLGGLATTKLTLWRSKCSRITASVTITTSIGSPVSPNALPINPYLSFPHTVHVQGQGFISFGSIEKCLPI